VKRFGSSPHFTWAQVSGIETGAYSNSTSHKSERNEIELKVSKGGSTAIQHNVIRIGARQYPANRVHLIGLREHAELQQNALDASILCSGNY
jgi:hypothetical protein